MSGRGGRQSWASLVSEIQSSQGLQGGWRLGYLALMEILGWEESNGDMALVCRFRKKQLRQTPLRLSFFSSSFLRVDSHSSTPLSALLFLQLT